MTKQVIETSNSIWNAMQTGDISSLEALVYQDAVFVHMGGSLNREEELEVIESKKIVYKHVNFQEQSVIKIENSYTILNKLQLTAIVGGDEVVNPFIVTETYLENEGVIKMTSLAFTRVIG